MAKVDIELQMEVDDFKVLAKSKPVSAGQQLEPELMAFDEHLVRGGIDPMGRFERQMVKEYIGFKLTQS